MLDAGPAGSLDVPGGHIDIVRGVAEADDCAELAVEGSLTLVWGSDYIRGAGFQLFELGLLDLYDLGWYLVGANISDIAAMGARPLGVLCVVRYPDDFADGDFVAIMRGARDAAAAFGCAILGGDTGGAERLILSGSALGACSSGRALRRSGARPGDVVCLTGRIGRPSAAVVYFSTRAADTSRHLSEAIELDLLSSWRRVQPRVAHGRLLSEHGLATACQDVSDGLRATTTELAAASGVCIEIEPGQVPIDDSALHVADLLGVDPLALAISASVDFELLFSVSRGDIVRAERVLEEAGLPLYRVGRVASGQGAVLRDRNGRRPLPGIPWHSQEGDPADLIVRGLTSTD